MKFKTLTCIAAMALLTALAIPVVAQEQQNKKPPRYTIKVLGTLGGTFSEAVGINNRGSLAGSSSLLGDQTVHAFLWQNGMFADLGTLGGPISVAPEAEPQPNERGEVAGASDTSTPDPNGEDFCFFGTHLICLPFIWEKGVLTALPTLGGNNGEAWEINNRGQVAGTAENRTPDPSCAAFQLEAEPVIWERGRIQGLPTVSGDLDGAAFAISDRGQAVGSTGNCVLGVPLTSLHAVLWQRDGHRWTATDLGNLGGTKFNLAFGINNRGQVVGSSGLPGDTAFHAFLWTKDDGMRDLGTLPADVVSWAETINSKDQAVGTSFDASGNMHPFLWQNGVMTNLNTLIPAGSPMFLLEALGNNDLGQIVGYGRLSNGDVQAYVLTPCDENHGGDEECEEGGGENALLQTSPAPRDVPNRTLPPSLVRRMGRYHFPGPAFGPRN